MQATIIKDTASNSYSLVVTPVEGMKVVFDLTKAGVNSLLVDAKNLLKLETESDTSDNA